jgi:hypothetical protein
MQTTFQINFMCPFLPIISTLQPRELLRQPRKIVGRFEQAFLAPDTC